MTTAAEDVTRTEAWLIASRPHTLPASAAPVIVGSGLAVHAGVFALWPTVAALVSATLIQIGANLANDYYDAIKGVDSEDSPGYTRVTQAGLLAPERVRAAMLASFGLAMVVGLYLVYVGGLPILLVGLAGVVSGIAYAGGPYPLGSHGLGDLFVFVFFGIVAVVGTFYVQAAHHAAGAFPLSAPPGTLPVEAFLVSLAPAGIVTNILVVNNVRDLESDREAGKNTLAVIVGYRWSRFEFVGNLGLAYLVPIVMWLQFGFDPIVLLPLGTIPYAALVTRTVLTRTDEAALNPALEQTGKLLAAHAVLFGLGMVLAA